MTQITQYVRAGAQILDLYDRGWYRKIQDPIDLTSSKRCVLAQWHSTGSYRKALRELGIHQPGKYGFLYYRSWKIAEAQRAWRMEILQRQMFEAGNQRRQRVPAPIRKARSAQELGFYYPSDWDADERETYLRSAYQS